MTDTMPEKLDLETTPIREERIEQLRRLFPEAFTEGEIDFDALRRSLGDAVSTDPASERFGLRWPGKGKLQQVINQPSVGTLVPQPQESVDWDTTQNLIIEGDNLEVLKLLQKSYAGQVKMIYIDPPYNTGNDFVYPDNFTEGLQTYLEFTGQVDSGGRKLSSNTETTGRYHANWLNMMYPRLYLARNLLRDDGVIFVSIDDHEVHNLRVLMNDVFGEENFIAQLVWENREGGGGSDSRQFKIKHEYILCYGRQGGSASIMGLAIESDEGYTHEDEHVDQRGRHKLIKLNSFSIQYSSSLDYPIDGPDGLAIYPSEDGRRGCWRWSKAKVEWGLSNGFVVFRRNQNGNWGVYTKQYFKVDNNNQPIARSETPIGVIPEYSSTMASKQMEELLGTTKIFDYTKPWPLIDRLLQYATHDTDVILDFFAGSGTTGHAAMIRNARDGGSRRFVLVQLPEPVDSEKNPSAAKFCAEHRMAPTISAITRERVRRAARKVRDNHADAIAERETPLDTGFRAYRLAASNFCPWDGRLPGSDTPKQGELLPRENITRQLEMAADHLRPGATDEAILAELLLKIGLDLTAPVTVETLAGKRVYNVEDGTVLVCFDRQITLDAIEQMAKRLPAEIICLDAGFPNDQTKVNAGQIVASAARDAEGSIEFKVV